MLGCHDPGLCASPVVCVGRPAAGLGEVVEDAVDGALVGDEGEQSAGGPAVGARQGIDEVDAAKKFGPERAWSRLGLWLGRGRRRRVVRVPARPGLVLVWWSGCARASSGGGGTKVCRSGKAEANARPSDAAVRWDPACGS